MSHLTPPPPVSAAPGRTISPGSGGRRQNTTVHDKLESLKAWSISTYKCSRQLIAERLGRSTPTVDAGEWALAAARAVTVTAGRDSVIISNSWTVVMERLQAGALRMLARHWRDRMFM